MNYANNTQSINRLQSFEDSPDVYKNRGYRNDRNNIQAQVLLPELSHQSGSASTPGLYSNYTLTSMSPTMNNPHLYHPESPGINSDYYKMNGHNPMIQNYNAPVPNRATAFGQNAHNTMVSLYFLYQT